MNASESLHVEHTGWLEFPPGDLVAQYVRQGWFEFTERAFLWVYLRRGNTYLDIGAHAGFHAATARQVVGESGTVVCVEPNPALHPLLQANVASLDLRPVAVSDQTGSARLQIASAAGSSFAHLSDDTGGIEINTVTLPQLMASLNGNQPELIKIDIEGAELALFASAEDVLADFDGVVLVEFSKENLERAGATTEALEAMVRGLGLEICRYDPTRNRLVPAQPQHPVWYENYYLCRRPGQINRRLARASQQHRRIATDICAKGLIAKANHELIEAHQKADLMLADLCDNFRGLHAFVESNGSKPLKPKRLRRKRADRIADLQDLFGASKAIAEYTLDELERRQNLLADTAATLSQAVHSTLSLEDVLGVSRLHELQADRGEVDPLEAGLVDARQLIESYQTINARAQGLMESLAWATSTQETQAQLVATLESALAEKRDELQIQYQALAETRQSLDSANQSLQDDGAELARTHTTLEHTTAELTQKGVDLDQAYADLTQLRADLNQAHSDLGETRTNLQHAEKDRDQKALDLDQAYADLTQLRADLNQAHSDLGETRTNLQHAEKDRDQKALDLDQAYAELTRLRADLTQTHSELSQVRTAERRGQAELEQSRQGLARALDDVGALESELSRSAAELGAQLADASNNIAALTETRDQLLAKTQELQTTLRERHAYYAGLISGAVNDLYELKRSRLIRLGSRLNANAGKKIDTTIEKMSS